MTKRIKRVFTNNMVAHVWAQQTQDNGRNGTSSIYFDNETIYSYGSHFPIASFIDSETVLITDQTSSVTTSQHVGLARRAIPDHIKVIECHQVAYYDEAKRHSINIQHYQDRIAANQGRCKRSLKYFKWCFNDLQRASLNAIEYCRYYKLKHNFEVPQWEDKFWEKARIRWDNREAIEEAQIKKQRIASTKEFRINLPKWLKGENLYKGPYNYQAVNNAYQFPVFLRITTDPENGDQKLESTHGAEIPMSFKVIKVWEMVAECKANKYGKVFANNAPKLGYFQIREIHKNGNLQIGCHLVKYGILKSIARQLDILNTV